MSEKLPEWPDKDDMWDRCRQAVVVDGVDLAVASQITSHAYERARAEAAIARLRVAVDELNALREDDCHWYTSALEFQNMDGLKRLASLETALALIGPPPKE